MDYDEDAARQVVAEAAGYPYFIQEYGLELWNHPDASPIDLEDLETVREIVQDNARAELLWHPLSDGTDAEQRYLAAMAATGETPYRVGQVASSYGARDQRGVSGHRDGLIQKSLAWSPRRGQVDFIVPLFAEYLRENHPLESFE